MNLVFQIIFTVMGTFLSVVLTKFLIQNGRAIAENGRAIAENGRAIAENGRAIAELGEKMDERTAMLANKIDQTIARLDERTTMIAELIVSEGERTRELMRALFQQSFGKS